MNTYSSVICLMAFAVAAFGSVIPAASYVPVNTIATIPNPDYGFNYAVNDPHTGDNKAQWESRHGDVVKGAYSLVEPDGNIRLVHYHADPLTGFNAVVKRTGPNIHPIPVPVVPAPVVAKPIAPIVPVPAPVVAPLHAPFLPILPAHGPWVGLHGHGHPFAPGYIAHGWHAGPMPLHGKMHH